MLVLGFSLFRIKTVTLYSLCQVVLQTSGDISQHRLFTDNLIELATLHDF